MLFTERAAAASGNFELTTANQAAVVDLCRRLDGLPLAIELAAVRTRALTVGQVLDRLADRVRPLTRRGRGPAAPPPTPGGPPQSAPSPHAACARRRPASGCAAGGNGRTWRSTQSARSCSAA